MNMKTKFINQALSELTHPKISVAIALACGFWVSQFLAWPFVATVLGILPNIIGVLIFGALICCFILRLYHPWSRLPAILGLCSSCVLVALYAYLNYFLSRSVEFIELLFLLSLGLAFIGVVIDVERCWHWIANAGTPNQALKPTRPSGRLIFRR
jgi:hypothetical protein